jgi:peptidoglycan-associated lipoprotein
MRKIIECLVILSFGALVSGGCAKKDMVKTEEPVSAVQTAPPTAPEVVKPMPMQMQEAKPESSKAEPMTETSAKEANVKQETAKESMQGTQLQNELQKIYFNFDSAALSDESRSSLSHNADLLVKQSSLKVRIEGNCDERGSDEYNMALGERRAKAAKDYLVSLGVQPERIAIISYGEEKPADPGHDEAAWAKNRRDEFIIVK